MSIKCFDIVKMVADEASDQFGSLLMVNIEKEEELKEICEMIDDVAEDFNGISYEVDINDETTDIIICLVCDEFETDSSNSVFLNLLNRTKKVGFKQAEDDKIQIEFVFNGIWSRRL